MPENVLSTILFITKYIARVRQLLLDVKKVLVYALSNAVVGVILSDHNDPNHTGFFFFGLRSYHSYLAEDRVFKWCVYEGHMK